MWSNTSAKRTKEINIMDKVTIRETELSTFIAAHGDDKRDVVSIMLMDTCIFLGTVTENGPASIRLDKETAREFLDAIKSKRYF